MPATPAKPHRPDGKIAYALASTPLHNCGGRLGLTQCEFFSGCVRRAAIPSPDGKVADELASTHAGTTAADAPVNYSMYVPQTPEFFPTGPMGKLLTFLPQLTLAQLRPTLWSTTVGTCRRDFEFSHCPDRKVADTLASINA
jgi:hypothetical protein